MKRYLRILLAIMLVAVLSLTLFGCSEKIRESKDYYFYTYDSVVGEFVKTNAKITFKKDNYTIFNGAGNIVDVGTHSTNNGYATFLPEKTGANTDQIASATYFYVYDEYIVNTGGLLNRVTDKTYADKSELEGRYFTPAGEIKLDNGKFYSSIDGSNTESSFTVEEGTYETKKDFITFKVNDGTVEIRLIIEYTNANGLTVKALASNFYSYRKPKFDTVSNSAVEIATNIYANTSVSGAASNYTLELLSYPNNDRITSGVTYTIIGVSTGVISGNTLTFTGVGNVTVEYTYGNIVDQEDIYIVDCELLPGITSPHLSYSVGDVWSFSKILSDVSTYSNITDWGESISTYEFVNINNTNVTVSNQNVSFDNVGNISAEIGIRVVQTMLDGTTKEVVISRTITIAVT